MHLCDVWDDHNAMSERENTWHSICNENGLIFVNPHTSDKVINLQNELDSPFTFQSGNSRTLVDFAFADQLVYDSIKMEQLQRGAFNIGASHSALLITIKNNNVVNGITSVDDLNKTNKTFNERLLKSKK